MNSLFTRLLSGGLLLATSLMLMPIQSARADDPASRVARISYLKGRVFMQPATTDAWTEARINRPLTSGDRLTTEGYSRSELQVGRTTLQLDANTQLRVLELGDEALQVEVTQGTVNVYARDLEREEVLEIDTPSAAITVQEPGTYRIDVSADDDEAVVQAREGRAEIAGERQSFDLRSGEQLRLIGLSRLSATYDDVSRLDEFDRWARERNERGQRSASTRYVASDVIGYQDLDDHGYWRWYQDYGYVWTPTRVVAGWAPYRYGHWVWISPWGWTWVDDAPWGFAPFHYGRWTQISNRWCWVPGPRTARPVYAPALVAWVGTPGVNVSINLGNAPVGWIPLGPREVYRPYYSVSNNYIINVNINNSLLTRDEFDRGYRRKPHEDDYRNRQSMSVVDANALANARPVKDHLVRNNERLQPLEAAPLSRPDTVGLLGGERRSISSPVVTRPVLARRQPVDGSTRNGPALNERNTSQAPRQPATRRDEVRIVSPPTVNRDDNRGGTRNQVERENRGGIGGTDNRRMDRPSLSPRRTDDQAIETRPSGNTLSLPDRSERSTVGTPVVRPSQGTQPRAESSAIPANESPAFRSGTHNESPRTNGRSNNDDGTVSSRRDETSTIMPGNRPWSDNSRDNGAPSRASETAPALRSGNRSQEMQPAPSPQSTPATPAPQNARPGPAAGNNSLNSPRQPRRDERSSE